MPIKISESNTIGDDNMIIAVCMCNYLNNVGASDDNFHVVRILRKIITKLPKKTQRILEDTFKLENHYKYPYRLNIINGDV